MKIYLSARYSRLVEMCRVREEIEARGHTVVSRWLNTPDRPQATLSKREMRKHAQDDIEDLREAELVICFTEDEDAPRSHGGRHVEFGMAFAWDKPVVVIGPEENVFYTIPEVAHADEWHQSIMEHLERFYGLGGVDGTSSVI